MKKSNYKKITSPCGLTCSTCVIYLANTDKDIRKRVAKQFNIPPEKVGCPGCRLAKGKSPIMPVKCKIYKCSEKKGIKFCRDCPDFPCDLLHPYMAKVNCLRHNIRVFNLTCLIKKIGSKSWTKEKKI